MNKKIAILLTSIFSIIIICGAVFAFQRNGQSEEKKNIFPDKFGNNGFRSIQNNEDDKQEDLTDYSAQAVLVDGDKDGKKQELNFTQTLNLFAEVGKDLFGIKRERIFQPINKIVELRKNYVTSKIIKVPEDYKMIQSAIDNADFGDTVKVSAGEYKENIIMKEGVSLIGSNVLEERMKKEKHIPDLFQEENKKEEKTEEDSKVSESDPAFSLGLVIMNETIINGKNSGNVVSFKNGITNKTKLANFTIKNAGKNLNGILIENSSPLIYDNIITNNEYNIYIKGNSSPVIQKNSLHFGGKGIQVYNFAEEKSELGSETSEPSSDFSSGAPIIIDNLITDNKIGIGLYQASAVIDHNTISYNNHYKTYLGATFGIYMYDSSAKISNNIITDSGICDLCAGVNVDEKSRNVVLSYNNIWNNKNDFVCFGECVLEDNNISEEPMFVNPANRDFKLREESGLIGKGEEGSDVGVRW